MIKPGQMACLSASARKTTSLKTFWYRIPRWARADAVWLTQGLSQDSPVNGRLCVLLLGYALLWAASADIRNLGLPLHGDMLEAFALSRELSFGYVKHPPLINWIVAAWFSAMPIVPWAFYLLSLLNAALAMWFVWLGARFVVDARRAVLAVALLGLTPIFAIHAALFNHNTFQLSLWPMVTAAFLASITYPGLIWSVAFGAASGAAILAKYYGALIVVACVLATFLHPDRRAYWRSVRPYLAGAICILLVSPNLIWLYQNEFVSLYGHVIIERHRVESAGSNRFLAALMISWMSVLAYCAELIPVFFALWFCLLRRRQAFSIVLTDWNARRAMVACLAGVPIVLPFLLLPLAGIALRDPWNYPAYFFAPLVVLSAPRLLVTRRAQTTVIGAVAMAAILALLFSPLAMIAEFYSRGSESQPLAALSQAATDLWHDRMKTPLRFVGGSLYPSWALTFYSPDHPHVLPGSAHIVDLATVEQQWRDLGVLGICGQSDSACNAVLSLASPDAEKVNLTLPVTFLIFHLPSVDYELYVQPPQGHR